MDDQEVQHWTPAHRACLHRTGVTHEDGVWFATIGSDYCAASHGSGFSVLHCSFTHVCPVLSTDSLFFCCMLPLRDTENGKAACRLLSRGDSSPAGRQARPARASERAASVCACARGRLNKHLTAYPSDVLGAFVSRRRSLQREPAQMRRACRYRTTADVLRYQHATHPQR